MLYILSNKLDFNIEKNSASMNPKVICYCENYLKKNKTFTTVQLYAKKLPPNKFKKVTFFPVILNG